MTSGDLERDVEQPLFNDKVTFSEGQLREAGAREFREEFAGELYLDIDGKRAVYELVNPLKREETNYRLRHVSDIPTA